MAGLNKLHPVAVPGLNKLTAITVAGLNKLPTSCYIAVAGLNKFYPVAVAGLNKSGFQKKLQTWAFGSTSADTYIPSGLGPPSCFRLFRSIQSNKRRLVKRGWAPRPSLDTYPP